MRKTFVAPVLVLISCVVFSSPLTEEHKRQILMEEWHGAMSPLTHQPRPATTAKDFTALQAAIAPASRGKDRAPEELQEEILLKGIVGLDKAISEIAAAVGMTAVIGRGIDLHQVVNLDFEDTPAADVLKTVLSPLGYSYEIKGRQLHIIAFTTRSFRVVMPPLSQDYDARTTNVHTAAAAAGDSESGRGGAAIGTNITVATAVKDLNVWDELEGNISEMLTEDGRVRINRTAGIISVTDYVPVVAEVEKYVTFVNNEISKQVLLKAKIVEVGLRREQSYGINWELVRERFTLDTGFLFRQAAGTPAVFTLPYGIGDIGTEGMSAVIKALEGQGDVNIISQPQTLVLNNQPAAIQVGDVNTYVSKLSRSVTETSETFSVETGSFQSGVTMSLVARVIDQDNIYLNIVPTISNLLSLERAEFAEGSFVHLPQTNTRSMNSIIKARSGETIVIGGLILQHKEEDRQGIPVLSSMPVIGRFFGVREHRKAASEIVIFITPVTGEPMT